MNKIYTSYFANIKKLNGQGIEPISIALFPPKWYEGKELKALAPDVTFFEGYKEHLITEERFKKFYQYKIEKIGKNRILEMINEIADGDVALLCFERPGEMCHRHILGNYLGIEEF